MNSRIFDFLGLSAWRRRREEKKLVRDLGKYINFEKVAELVAQQETGGVSGQEKEPIRRGTNNDKAAPHRA